jgi:NADPH:quinone reductase-like Zn-dependent oxidoreductase
MGAHHVIDHTKPLAEQVEALGIGAPGFVFSTTHSADYVEQIGLLIAPQGRFGLIDDPARLDISPLKRKSISTHFEFMFTRAMFQTADIAEQGKLLNEVARLVDSGALRSTVTERFSPIDAAHLRQVHRLIEGGKARGKLVLEGF